MSVRRLSWRGLALPFAVAGASFTSNAHAADPAEPVDATEASPELAPHPAAAIAPPATATSPSAPDVGSTTAGAAAPLIPKAITGFATLNGGYKSQPDSIPQYRSDVTGSMALGAGVTGTAFEHWQYLAYLVLGISADATSGTSAALSTEQITVAYVPNAQFTFQAGYMRIPFSLAQAGVISKVMFPTRPQATTLFQSGTDAGFLASFDSAHVHTRLGVFEGLSLGLLLPNYVSRGLVISAFVDVEPLGPIPTIEADTEGGGLRVALSGGALYRPATEYDPTGYTAVHLHDTRFSASLRLALAGFYAQGEYLQDVQTDSLSARPRIARGTYGELSYYFPIAKKIALSPLGRIGWSEQDADFMPLREVTVDAGFAFYPRADLARPGTLRLLFEYTSDRLLDQAAIAYGGFASALYSF